MVELYKGFVVGNGIEDGCAARKDVFEIEVWEEYYYYVEIFIYSTTF